MLALACARAAAHSLGRATPDGDPARVVAAADRIPQVLGWRARHSLDEIVSSAWAAYS